MLAAASPLAAQAPPNPQQPPPAVRVDSNRVRVIRRQEDSRLFPNADNLEVVIADTALVIAAVKQVAPPADTARAHTWQVRFTRRAASVTTPRRTGGVIYELHWKAGRWVVSPLRTVFRS
jgi:hypothetical protein